jgi:hypothetical protein
MERGKLSAPAPHRRDLALNVVVIYTQYREFHPRWRRRGGRLLDRAGDGIARSHDCGGAQFQEVPSIHGCVPYIIARFFSIKPEDLK